MRVAAQNQRRRAWLGTDFDLAQRRGKQFAVADVFEKTLDIALGSGMTEKNAIGRPQRRRQPRQPFALRSGDAFGAMASRSGANS